MYVIYKTIFVARSCPSAEIRMPLFHKQYVTSEPKTRCVEEYSLIIAWGSWSFFMCIMYNIISKWIAVCKLIETPMYESVNVHVCTAQVKYLCASITITLLEIPSKDKATLY